MCRCEGRRTVDRVRSAFPWTQCYNTTEALRAAGLLTELSPEEQARAVQSTLTLDESHAVLDRAGGPPLSLRRLQRAGEALSDRNRQSVGCGAARSAW